MGGRARSCVVSEWMWMGDGINMVKGLVKGEGYQHVSGRSQCGDGKLSGHLGCAEALLKCTVGMK